MKENFFEKLNIILSSTPKLKRGETKIIKCPLCGKDRKISCSSYNGHIHNICESKNCVNMME